MTPENTAPERWEGPAYEYGITWGPFPAETTQDARALEVREPSMSDEARARVETYIAAYEDAPTWGGPTMYPAPPSIADIKALLALAAKPLNAGEGPLMESGERMVPVREEADAPERNGIPCWLWHRLWSCGPQLGYFDKASQWWRIIDGTIANGDLDLSRWTAVGIVPSHWHSTKTSPVEHSVAGWGASPTPAIDPVEK